MNSKQETQLDSDVALMEAVDFSAQDISSNRKGVFSDKQSDILRKQRSVWRFYSAITLLTVPIFITLAILDGVDRRDTFSSRIGIIAFILTLVGVIFFYCHSKWKQFVADGLESRVILVEGIVRLERYSKPNAPRYRLRIETMQFEINWRVFEAFETGRKYRIYYAQHSKRIMSAEPVA